MTLSEIIAEVRALSRADMLQIMQILADDLAKEEPPFVLDTKCPVWSPNAGPKAVAILLAALEAELRQAAQNEQHEHQSLRGAGTEYENPFEPAVPLEDWEVLR